MSTQLVVSVAGKFGAGALTGRNPPSSFCFAISSIGTPFRVLKPRISGLVASDQAPHK
jgi:hypothetical protein